MTRRTRSILIDATLGKIFINTNANTPTDPSKLIAGTKLASKTLSAAPKVAVRVINNLGGKATGIPFVSGGLLVSARLLLKVAALGSPIIINVKTGTDYASATTRETLTLEPYTVAITLPLSTTVPVGHSVYYDIAQVGSLKPGYGLSITLNYYAG